MGREVTVDSCVTRAARCKKETHVLQKCPVCRRKLSRLHVKVWAVATEIRLGGLIAARREAAQLLRS